MIFFHNIRKRARGMTLLLGGALLFGAAFARAEPSDVTTTPPPAPLAPLPIGERAVTPRAFAPGWWLAGALGPALMLWAALALVRAERTESTFAQRRARRALAKLMRGWRASSRVPTNAELETWCALTAKLFAVPRAAPTANDLRAGFAKAAAKADAAAWLTLWREAREALFAAQHPLPAGWPLRAAQALAATRIERTASRFPNRRHHWWPRVAAVIAAGVTFSANPVAAAATAEEAWARGEFSAAREIWREHLNAHPDDWAAQHNVALAYQREDWWGPATAHWAAAFVLNPREPVVADAMRVVVGRMEGIDPTLQRIVAGKWHERAAAVMSPGEWQQLAKFGAVLFAFGLVAGVLAIYRGGKGGARLAFGLGVSGVLGFGAGVGALHRYGVLARPEAACLARAADLRAVPSELVEQEKTAPLLAGQIVTIDGHYFGWTRITVRSGAVGWVRRDAVLPLYAAPVARGATGFARSE